MSWIQPHLVDQPHWVYRLYTSDSRLLYVGCTSLPPDRRMISLRGENPRIKRAPVRFWTALQYPTGPSAQIEEGRLIDALHPPYNGHGSGRKWQGTRRRKPINYAAGMWPAVGRWPERQSA